MKDNINLGGSQRSSVRNAGGMIMFNTLGDEQMRTMPRILEGEDRNKFIAAVRSPLARDLLNYDVRFSNRLSSNGH